jgi:hypothetical protein
MHIIQQPGASASPYTLSARYMIYASQDANRPLKEEWFTLACETIPDDPIAAIYNAIAADKFEGKTITHDT